MNDSLKTLSAETRAAILESVAKKDFASVISLTKAASKEDSGNFKVVVSTANTDRQGDSVNQAGWDLSYFKMNPVVLWAHDYGTLPIGICTSIEVVEGKLVAEGKFAPAEANPFAQQVRKLYELGMVNTTSVGFIPKKFDDNNSAIIMEQELLEFSFVPVPANPHALRLDEIKALGLDVPMLKTKSIEIVEKVEEKKEEVKKFSIEETDIKSLIEETVKSTITSLRALGSLKLAEGDKDNAGDSIVDKGSKPLEALAELNDFVEARTLLRTIDNSVEKLLRRFNLSAKKFGSTVK